MMFPRLFFALLGGLVVTGSELKAEVDRGPVDSKTWPSSVVALEKIDPAVTQLALRIDKRSEGPTLLRVVAKRFSKLQELRIYQYPHLVEAGVVEKVALLPALKSLHLSGDMRLSKDQLDHLTRIPTLEEISFDFL